MNALVNFMRQAMSLPLTIMQMATGQQAASTRTPVRSPPASSPTASAPIGGDGDATLRCGCQVLVCFEVFHTIIEPRRLQEAITATHDQLNHIFTSGKVLASGSYAGKRGGFVLLEVRSTEELLGLVAPGLSDNCSITMEPVLPFDQQAEALASFGFQVPN